MLVLSIKWFGENKTDYYFMERKNIWTEFKNELGFTTASIQYIELTCRIAAEEHKTDLSGQSMVDIAKKHGLSISMLPKDIQSRIASNYIIQIHSCVNRFLNDFKQLVGSPVYQLECPKKEDILTWTANKSLLKKTENDKILINICNYYRLLRNAIIHKGEDSNELRIAYSNAKKAKTGKLKAINKIEDVCFDDQVLFARSARSLLERIYTQSNYDWKKIIDHEQQKIKEIELRYQNDKEQQMVHTNNYLKRFYPVPKSGVPIDL